MSAVADARWWIARKNGAAETIWDVVRSIHDRTRWLLDKDVFHAELYECEGALRENNRGARYQQATLPRNVVRQAVETLTARVANERPLPSVQTTGGDWGMQKRARRANEAVEGEFYRCKVFEELTEAWVTDALTSRAGVLKVCRGADGRVLIERVLPWELYVDPIDARYGRPRNMYHVRTVDRAVLAAMFPTRAKEIRETGHDDAAFDWTTTKLGETATVDRVRVIEAWHLASGPGADDGRHVICIDGLTLRDEPWPHDYFPFQILKYSDRKVGFWGYPLAERLEGWQYEINETQQRVSESHALAPGGIVATPIGSDIVDSHIINGNWYHLKYRGNLPPNFFTPNPVAPQHYQYLRDLGPDALGDVGVSQTSAQSQKPAGITAARALQVLDDVETQRFAMFVRRYQAACVGLAEKLLDVIRDIAESEGDYTVKHTTRRGVRELSWTKDFALDRESYSLKIYSTSLLSKRPEARFQQLEVWINQGRISWADYLRLSEMPDTVAEADIATAAADLARDQVTDMLEHDNPDDPEAYQPPFPYGDLEYAKRFGQLSLCLAKRDNVPQANRDLLQRYVDDVLELIKLAAAPPENDAGGMPSQDLSGAGPAGPLPPPGAPGPGPMPPMPMPPDAMPPGAPPVAA